MKIQHIDVDGQRVRIAVRAGYDDGVPLLLINGIGASLEALQPFVDALDPALTVIRFDVPGTGGSPPPQRPYRFGGLCKLIAALLSQLGHDTADVLGISWGGAPILRAPGTRGVPSRARRRPLQVDALGELSAVSCPGQARPRRGEASPSPGRT
jgi:pimeloyl-ACP methyl ester carboxylesterase